MSTPSRRPARPSPSCRRCPRSTRWPVPGTSWRSSGSRARKSWARRSRSRSTRSPASPPARPSSACRSSPATTWSASSPWATKRTNKRTTKRTTKRAPRHHEGNTMTETPKRDLIVAHYHEVGLKGRNRSFFERRLVEHIRWGLRDTGYAKVRAIPGRILVELTEDADLDRITEALGRTFGLSSFSPAVSSPADIDSLVATALDLAREAPFESFRVRARRGHSSFPESSQRVNEVVGQAIMGAPAPGADLSRGGWPCHIELVQNRAFLYANRLPGPGGLPAGTAGRVVALLSGGIDSPVA